MAQISPIWFNKAATLTKVESYVKKAGEEQCDLVVFSEGLIPGYPFWLDLTHASSFNSTKQKEIFAHYVKHAVVLENGDLDEVGKICREHEIAAYLGIIERPADRGGHSLYCSLVYINAAGQVQSVHRKLQPTYEERLAWSPGDGHGLQVHKLGNFKVGGLNCWENWMPLARAALYALGEDLHIAVWPGADHHTRDVTRFIARESRSYVISVGGLFRREHIGEEIPHQDQILENAPEIIANGGSCVAGPDGEWVLPPLVDKEGLITTVIDHDKVLQERQNFDPSGHYSRPDVTRLQVNRRRQSSVEFKD